MKKKTIHTLECTSLCTFLTLKLKLIRNGSAYQKTKYCKHTSGDLVPRPPTTFPRPSHDLPTTFPRPSHALPRPNCRKHKNIEEFQEHVNFNTKTTTFRQNIKRKTKFMQISKKI